MSPAREMTVLSRGSQHRNVRHKLAHSRLSKNISSVSKNHISSTILMPVLWILDTTDISRPYPHSLSLLVDRQTKIPDLLDPIAWNQMQDCSML